ncbi:tRNA lysidine(34) synthetase TilS [Macrococcus carouselicus]|uniref:tRNA(Ile)-lysidine synthase n=1 Tax=Macrococcus carouselicus TaxID=69969 RepID=A0A9Q8FNJ8_9STAP|nr:tRNA lysidine(34) synthetase TilS [Macrococcus carouselicus]TDL95293.1 tRNA lysidine(34) synthetase TilS [Macrococcus carouselicus]
MEVRWKQNDHVAIAVSGGVDSMVLLEQVRLSGHYQSLTILHVHHGLREQSDAEAEMIKRYAEKHQLRFLMRQVPADYFNSERSIQNEARELRYRFFSEMMNEYKLDCLLTAHHQGDQQETVLFRLLTGRFHSQPLGMTPMTVDRGYPVYKPLLNETKHALYVYAEKQDVPYMEDQSNGKTDYTRNAIRHELLPAIDRIEGLSTRHLIELADWQNEMLGLVAHRAAEVLDSMTRHHSYSRSAFTSLPLPVQRQVLLQLSHSSEGTYQPLSRHYSDEIIRVIATDKTQAVYPLSERLHLEIAYDMLYIRYPSTVTRELLIHSPGEYEFNGYLIQLMEPITDIIRVRVSEPGDRILINQQRQKINRIMLDAKVPTSLRRRMPIITINEDIIAVGDLKRNDHPANHFIIIKFKGE